MLGITNLHVRYGAVAAVRGVSLEVGRGELVCLLGPNGAGKSSLLGSIAGLVDGSGSVVIDGAEALGEPPERIVARSVALVPEGRRVFSGLSVADNLRMGGASERDRSVLARRTAEVLELFPVLDDRAAQLAGTLSGGQQQMLAIGRALMSGPELLLLDEPSLGLAPIVIREIFDLTQELRDRGVTILLVEQNATQALAIADRAYVLSLGRIELAGTAAEIGSSVGLESLYLGATSDERGGA